MTARRIEPDVLRARVIEHLAHLPPEEHLDALHSIDQGDVHLDLTDPVTVRVVLAGRWVVDIPAEGWVID